MLCLQLRRWLLQRTTSVSWTSMTFCPNSSSTASSSRRRRQSPRRPPAVSNPITRCRRHCPTSVLHTVYGLCFLSEASSTATAPTIAGAVEEEEEEEPEVEEDEDLPDLTAFSIDSMKQ